MATARVEDVERTVRLADELVGSVDHGGSVCLLQCGQPSEVANELSRELSRIGRWPQSVVITDRSQAQSDLLLTRVAASSVVWVFAEDLLEAFFLLFATPLAFVLRSKANKGFPVVGVGQGALALGGLVLANRICRNSHYDLVGGLGWAPRVLLDGGVLRAENDEAITRASVRSLPGLLGVELGVAGGIRVEGGRIESIGSQPIQLLGNGGQGTLLILELEPGKMTTIAPPPFVPFERNLLSAETLRALGAQAGEASRTSLLATPAPNAKGPSVAGTVEDADRHAEPGSGRHCPMCKKVHAAEPKLQLAA
jgi:hypothetical protein